LPVPGNRIVEKKHPPDAVAVEIADEWLADVAAKTTESL